MLQKLHKINLLFFNIFIKKGSKLLKHSFLIISLLLLVSIILFNHEILSINYVTSDLFEFSNKYKFFLHSSADIILQLFGITAYIFPCIFTFIWLLLTKKNNQTYYTKFLLISFNLNILILPFIYSYNYSEYIKLNGIIGEILITSLNEYIEILYIKIISILILLLELSFLIIIKIRKRKNTYIENEKIDNDIFYNISEEENDEEFVGVEKNIDTTKKKNLAKAAIQDIAAVFTAKKTIKTNILTNELASDYKLPSTNLINQLNFKKQKLSEGEINQIIIQLTQVLNDFGINGKIEKANPGPVVTLYELEPAAGTKAARIIGLADDIARSMYAISARIATIAGHNLIGIELPNKHREIVGFREILDSEIYKQADFAIPLALGRNIGGKIIVVDLTKMPHLLVAGTTGSGKSVAVNTMILSILYRLNPEECKFIMIDPKMLELSIYDGIPHLISPVVTDPKKAVTALKWVVQEMEKRYKMMSYLSVRNIDGFNNRIQEAIKNNETLMKRIQVGFDSGSGEALYEDINIELKKLPYIVVIVDEMADLMLVAGKEIETSVQRLAQMARAAGIHIIMATQRPSVDVITGVIKANFPTRISFQVTSKIDSRTILGDSGAEQLLGMGDMLYMAGGGRITRVHGAFISDEDVNSVVAYLKTTGQPSYISDILVDKESEDEEGSSSGSDDNKSELYYKALEIIKTENKATVSYLQRRLKIGYNTAANIIEKMEKEGIVSKPGLKGVREILL